MKRKTIPGELYLLLAALIWGGAFVAQSAGADKLGSFTINGIRSVLAAAVLEIVILAKREKISKRERIQLLTGGIVCGLCLFAASNVQQLAIGFVDENGMKQAVGKVSFMTSLYLVFVPVFGTFFGKKTGAKTWFCLALSVVGMFLLTEAYKGFRIGGGDALSLLCSVLFAFHIMSVGHYAPGVDCFRLSQIQFLVSGVLSVICAAAFETPEWSAIWEAKGEILYLGVLSSAGAFTFQVLGQKTCKPQNTCIILSMESVFGAVAGFLIMKESMNLSQILGSALILAAVLILQIHGDRKNAVSAE